MFDAQGSPGEALRELAQHRLLPVAALLCERGWLADDLAAAATMIGQALPGHAERLRALEAKVVTALADAGVEALVLKGALLAHTVYPAPETRLRSDLDVLIRASQVSQAEAVLTGLGMRIGCQSTSSPPPPQAQWVFVDAPTDFALDLHWALSNHQGLRGCLRFDELAAEAQPLPGLAPPARGLGRVHALLHACIHYYGHHRNQFKPPTIPAEKLISARTMS